MINRLLLAISLLAFISSKAQKTADKPVLTGTWQMISAKAVTNKDTAITFSAKDQKMIKIINGTHFAFFSHDLKKGKDSAAVFDSGAGTYSLSGNIYTEHLEYCNYREWEGRSFTFSIQLGKDTLIQRGIEKVESLNINREIIEEYVRIK